MKKQELIYKIGAPMSGRCVPITEVPDSTFSDKILGDGIAIIPENGKILPPFSALPGLGGAAAAGIMEARNDGDFFSIKEFQDRTHVSKSVTQLMKDYHILDGLPETDQVSFF